MSKEVGAGGRFDIFLDSANNNNIPYQYRITFSAKITGITKGTQSKR